MSSKCRGSESSYAAGCRCDLCKRAAAVARRERRRRDREAAGLVDTSDISDTVGLSPVSNPDCGCSTGDYLNTSVVAAVHEEISALGVHARPGLAAPAVSLAEVLDNPRATSSKPAAAGALVNLLNQLRKSAVGSKPKLASVRLMTKHDEAVCGEPVFSGRPSSE